MDVLDETMLFTLEVAVQKFQHVANISEISHEISRLELTVETIW